MKKKIIISAVLVFLAVLFIPVPKTHADGTKTYTALTYRVIKRSRQSDEGYVFVSRDFSAFPHNFGRIPPPDGFLTAVGETEASSQNGEKTTENETESASFEDSAVFFQSTRECEKNIISEKVQLSYGNDAGAVNEIFGRYTFRTDPYDNLPDYEITIGSHKNYYDSSSGIVTDSTVKRANEGQSFVLSDADRETINALIKKYADTGRKNPVSETENETEPALPETSAKPTTTIPNTYEYNPDDSVHFVRRSWSSSSDYPQVVFLRSKAELDAYNSDDLDEAAAKYTQDYFKKHALVIVFTSESSGSNYYTGAKINSAGNEIVIDRYVPPVGTCDMASWAVIIEVPASDPILTQDPAKTKVTFNNSNM